MTNFRFITSVWDLRRWYFTLLCLLQWIVLSSIGGGVGCLGEYKAQWSENRIKVEWFKFVGTPFTTSTVHWFHFRVSGYEIGSLSLSIDNVPTKVSQNKFYFKLTKEATLVRNFDLCTTVVLRFKIQKSILQNSNRVICISFSKDLFVSIIKGNSTNAEVIIMKIFK